MDEISDLNKQYREKQEKYIYYIIALSVTSIGFSIYKTTGVAFNWFQISLAAAVISWGISIYSDLTFIKYVVSNMYSNSEYMTILKGIHSETGYNSDKIKAATTEIRQAMDSNAMAANKYFMYQERLFYLGIISFILWHILEMYSNTCF